MILYYFEEFQYGKDSQIPQHLDVLMGGAYSERMFFLMHIFKVTMVTYHNKQYKKAFLRDVIISLEVDLQRS